jgi:hypothetical protein
MTATPPPNLTLYELVCKERLALETETGGIIHLITDEQAATVAKALYGAAAAVAPQLAKLTPAMTLDEFFPLVFAWVRGESGYDPACTDPNWPVVNGKPVVDTTQTPEQVFRHTDCGLGQIDGTELAGLFLDYSWEEQQAQAFDPEWAAIRMVATIVEDLAWGITSYDFFTAHGAKFPAIVTPWVIGAEAYNAGRSGALARAIATLGYSPAPTGASGDDFSIHEGTLILAADESDTDATETWKLVDGATQQNGTFLNYGQTVTSRWREYMEWVGATPTLGC